MVMGGEENATASAGRFTSHRGAPRARVRHFTPPVSTAESQTHKLCEKSSRGVLNFPQSAI